MNSKQRNSQMKFKKKMVLEFLDHCKQMLEDIDSGKTTAKKQLEKLNELSEMLS